MTERTDPFACGRCSRSSPAEARFCMHCGAPMVERPVAQGGPDPRTYTPRHLADKILTTRAALEGERKQVTVMFVDVQGSLTLAHEVDPEEWHRILDHFFQILADGIHRLEGTINQYTGDGVMALFGAPIAHEDHAQRACHAALSLSARLRRYQRELRRERGLDFHARMGLHSGEVIVGKIGDDLRVDYTAQGATVGVAARLQQIAEAGTAYLSAETARLVAGYFDLEDLGEFRLRGLADVNRVFALRGVGRLRTRFDAARARGFARFVGRTAALARLEGALDASLDGRGAVVDVTGDPGVGKSRLCFELLERARARGIRVFACHGLPHGTSVPFLPIVSLVRQFFEIDDGEDDRLARQKVAGAITLLGRELAEELPLLFDFLGIADKSGPALQVEGGGRQQRLFDLLRRVSESEPDDDPLVLFFEDLHWFDEGSLAFLEAFVPLQPDGRVLALATYRTGFHLPWLPAPEHPTVHLDPLEPPEASALLDDLLGGDPSLHGLAGRIQQRAGGNPLFLEEVVRSLATSGLLDGAPGRYRLVRPVGEIEIPSSIHALLASRIDQLSEPQKQLLQTAAVIGKRFAFPVLEAVSDLDPEPLLEALHGLESAEFVFEQDPYPESRWAFTHPLTQEVALASQLSDRRARLHARVAGALGRIHADEVDEYAALIARHFEEAGNPFSAARWTHRAARRVGPAASAEAMRLWRKLRDLVERSPRTPETAILGARACRWLLFLGASQGLSEEEADLLLAAGREFSTSTQDPRSLAITLANYGAYRAQILVEPERGLALTREALGIAQQHGEPRLQVMMEARTSLALANAGRLAECVGLALPLLSRVERRGTGTDPDRIAPLDQATLYRVAGDALNELGRLDEGPAHLERGIRFAREHDLLSTLAACHQGMVRLALIERDAGRAARHARDAFAVAERSGNPGDRVLGHDALCVAHLLAGHHEAAIAEGENALRLAAAHRVAQLTEDAQRAHLALAYLGDGRADEALAAARLAVEASARCGLRYRALAQLTLASALRAVRAPRDEIASARAAAADAIGHTGAHAWDAWLAAGDAA